MGVRLDQNSFMEDNRGERFSPWSTYSDMFCSLLMVFMLLFFYAMMQYVSAAAIDTAELETLRAEQTTIRAEADSEILAAEEKLNETLARLEAALSEAEQARSALAAAEEENAQARTELERAQTRLSSVESAAETDEDTKLKLGERIIALEQQVSSLTEEIEAGALREEAQRAQIAELSAEAEAVLAELSRMELSKAEIEALLVGAQSSLEQAQSENASLRTLNTQQQAVISEMNLRIAAQEAVMAQQNRALEDVAGIRVEIISALGAALNENGLEARVDASTGAIVLSSELLFGVNESALKPEGKAFLSEFLPVYLRVLTEGEFAGSVSQILVEGHTDTAGSYQTNLELSMQRAQSVAAYCVSLLDGEDQQKLMEMITAGGCSYSNPIYNDDGSVNMERSRRVEIKFTMKDQNMIDEIMRIVENE